MNNKFTKLDNIIKQDPGRRNLIDNNTINPIYDVCLSLTNAKHVIITTGFYIVDASAIETDGPPGAILLANALLKLGKAVTFIVDDHSEKIIRSGFSCFDNNPEFLFLDPGGKYNYQDIVKETTSHFISIERPGLNKDKENLNHKGLDISKHHYSLDSIFTKARSKNIITIAIGDGGNEMGLGNNYSSLVNKITNGQKICTITESNYPIYAGVSNWAGYAIAAGLSLLSSKDLLSKKETILCILNNIVESGSVDGISKKSEPTVDGLPIKWELDVYQSLFEIIKSTG